MVNKMAPNYSFILSSGLSVIFYRTNHSMYSCDDQFELHVAIVGRGFLLVINGFKYIPLFFLTRTNAFI